MDDDDDDILALGTFIMICACDERFESSESRIELYEKLNRVYGFCVLLFAYTPTIVNHQCIHTARTNTVTSHVKSPVPSRHTHRIEHTNAANTVNGIAICSMYYLLFILIANICERVYERGGCMCIRSVVSKLDKSFSIFKIDKWKLRIPFDKYLIKMLQMDST